MHPEWAKFSVGLVTMGKITYKRILEYFFRTRKAPTFDMMIGGGSHGGHKARWGNEKRAYLTLRFFNPGAIRGALARGWFSRKLRPASHEGEAAGRATGLRLASGRVTVNG